jgi:ABC-type lipoprotein export system ATPase subunit
VTVLYALSGVSRVFQSGPAALRALDDVSLSIAEGEFVAIAGPSGCGKTTLLHVLGLLDSGFSGEVVYRDRRLLSLSGAARAKVRMAELGLVFQSFHLLPALDVRHNVALPHWKLHGDRPRALARADALLSELGLGERLSHDVTRLSGGEMQRVAIARALVNAPTVLLADEPTGSLDSANTAVVAELLTRVHSQGCAVIVSSHDEEVLSMAARVVRLRYGRITSGEAPR